MNRRVLVGLSLVAVCTLATTCVAHRRAMEEETLTVFAAASLREVFQSIAVVFETEHPNMKVRFNFAGSQNLRVQIEQGAQAGLFASADWKQMKLLAAQGLVGEPVVFAHNSAVVVVPKSNNARLASFADLTRADHLVVGAPEVPIGAYAEAIFASAEALNGKAFGDQVRANIHSRELNVRQVLTKVAMGEADAGIVYRTDALTMPDKVQIIEIPSSINVDAEYPVAVVKATPQADSARAFVKMLLSGDGQQALGAAGFHPAEEPAWR